MIWKARVELFGPKRTARWVLVDPKGQLRASFYGLAKDDRKTAPLIARLLNEETKKRKKK